jgi:NAD-dependent DNA ligase
VRAVIINDSCLIARAVDIVPEIVEKLEDAF